MLEVGRGGMRKDQHMFEHMLFGWGEEVGLSGGMEVGPIHDGDVAIYAKIERERL